MNKPGLLTSTFLMFLVWAKRRCTFHAVGGATYSLPLFVPERHQGCGRGKQKFEEYEEIGYHMTLRHCRISLGKASAVRIVEYSGSGGGVAS